MVAAEAATCFAASAFVVVDDGISAQFGGLCDLRRLFSPGHLSTSECFPYRELFRAPPAQRMVLVLEGLHFSTSLQAILKRQCCSYLDYLPSPWRDAFANTLEKQTLAALEQVDVFSLDVWEQSTVPCMQLHDN